MATISDAVDKILKTNYTGEKLHEIVYKSSPLFRALKKQFNVGGDGHPIPLLYGTSGSTSGTFATALILAGSGVGDKYTAFKLTQADIYDVAMIAYKELDATKGNENSFIDIVNQSIKNKILSLACEMSFQLYGNGGGARGRISDGYNGSTITLTSASDARNFKIGMTLQSSSADGTSGSVRTGTFVVTAVDTDAGTITGTNTFSGGANNDYLFASGSFGSTYNISGLSAWVPSSTPAATAFFGVDRSVNPTRLGGLRVTGSATNVEDSLTDGMYAVMAQDGMVDTIVMNPLMGRNLQKELGSKRFMNLQDSEVGKFGNSEFVALLPGGTVKILLDPWCPNSLAYGLELDSWKLVCAQSELPAVDDRDGERVRRSASTAALEIRFANYWQLGCSAPGHNVRISLA